MEQPQLGAPPQPFVCDGRVDREKLVELLGAQAEFASLDFKRSIDLNDKSKKLEFIKDCAAMGNQPDGGYLVIGAEDNGRPAEGNDFSGQNLDSAALKDAVESYVDGHIDIRSQTHEITHEGRSYRLAVIYIAPPRDGFPLVTKKLGDVPRGKPVFQRGAVYTREGSQNVLATHKTWEQILHKLQQMARSAARADVDELIHRVVAQLGSGGPEHPILPDFDMDLPTFTSAVRTVLEKDQSSMLKRVILNGKTAYDQALDHEDRRVGILDKLTVLACESCLFDDTDTVLKVTDALFTIYKRNIDDRGILRYNAIRYGLEIISRIMIVGSLALRTEHYEVLPSIVLHPIGTSPYGYKSWIRHGLTEAARANLFGNDKAGVGMISAARHILVTTPLLSPDCTFKHATEETRPASIPDVLLHSLLQFDFLWCCIALNENPGGGHTEYYPSCAAYHQDSIQPILEKLDDEDGTFRTQVFGSSPDNQIAGVIREVYDFARSQSFQYGVYWPSIDRLLSSGFIRSHAIQ
ncbi:helix-turn-helix domain-containing protein [Glutamicibacter nicotianae]|uniref:AlbA family DNA-binding domain-containing protein n=1 Tax=Glutamicibacter nicotianae TaxID=37929 RepID=UPI000EF864C8|nr:ATP-binding protein [Glutamicibacter nicotianae]